MEESINYFQPQSFNLMKEISLQHQEDQAFVSIPFKKDSTIMYEDNDEPIRNDKQQEFKSNLQIKIVDGNSIKQQIKQVEDIHSSQDHKISFDSTQIIKNRNISFQPSFKMQLEPFSKQDTVLIQESFEYAESPNQESTQQIEKKKLQQIVNKQTLIVQPKKLQVSLFLKIWKFYTNLSANSCIFSKLTNSQHEIINDKSSFFENLVTLNQVKLHNNLLIKYFQYMLQLLIKVSPSFPVFMRSSLIVRIMEIIQSLSIVLLLFAFSLIVFFQQQPEEYHNLFTICLFIQLSGIAIQFNIAGIKKGNIITSRKFIAKKYLKKINFYFDLFGLLPLFVESFRVEISSPYIKYYIYAFALLLNFKLKNMLEHITFYLSFEKNLKNTIDLVKLILTIVIICHIFCLFWHGIAVIEIQNGQKNTWLHLKNLDQENSVLKRYIYSFYYLAVTMITVGYGDITPQNQYEISFSIMTMFVTGFYYAFSLNKIGSILDNINKKDKLYNQQMQIIHRYLRNENVSSNLRGKISSYLKYLYKESNEVQRNNEKFIVDKLSKQLKIDLIQEVSGKYLQNIPFLNQLKSKSKIIECLEECLYSPGEKIFTQGENEDFSLYFIVKGEVQLLFQSEGQNDKQSVIQKLQKGSYFGEYSFLTNQMRSCTVIANDFCRLYKIQKEKFMNIIRENENDYESFCMTRDQALLCQNFKNSSIKCYSCEKNSHHFVQCPKTHYVRSKQSIALQINHPVIQSNREYIYRRVKKINSLVDYSQTLYAAFLINKYYFSGFYNELSNLGFSEFNQVTEYDQNKYFQEQLEIDQDAQKYTPRGSISNLVPGSKNNAFSNLTQVLKNDQINNDFNANDTHLNKIEEISNDPEEQFENSSFEMKQRSSISNMIQQQDKIVTNQLNKQQYNFMKQKSFHNQKSLKSASNNDYVINQELNQKETNSHATKKNNQAIQKRQQFIKKKWNTDNLDKKTFIDEIQESDYNNHTNGNNQESTLQIQKENPSQWRKINQGNNSKVKKTSIQMQKNHKQNAKEDKLSVEQLNTQNSMVNAPKYKEDHSQNTISQNNLKTPELKAESGQLASPISSARQYFNHVKKIQIQKQLQYVNRQNSILRGLSSLQTNNLENSLEITKRSPIEQRRNSSIYQTNQVQPYIYNDEKSSKINLETSQNSPKTRTQKSEYQVVIKQQQGLDRNIEQSLYKQPTNIPCFKDLDQEQLKWVQYTTQQKNNYSFDSVQGFDIPKIYTKYFPQFNLDIVLSFIRKKQLSLRVEKRKSQRKLSLGKKFDSSKKITIPKMNKIKLFNAMININNNNNKHSQIHLL